MRKILISLILFLLFPTSVNAIDKYTINFTNKLIQEDNEGIQGRINYCYKNIIVRTDTSKEKTLHTLLHELGHAYDTVDDNDMSYAGEYSDTDYFWDIYEKESYNCKLRGYYKNNIHEYFAESFAEYIDNKSKLLNERPLTFYYIENIMKER